MDLSAWDRLSRTDAEEHARGLVPHLPAGFRFRSVAAHVWLGTSRHVALFEREGDVFALIPGGRVILGYDRSSSPVLTDAQREAWSFTEREYGLSLEGYLDSVLSPLRTVELAPFLLETTARRCGWTPLPPRRRLLPWGEQEQGGWSVKGVTHAEVALAAAWDGLRLPTSDEWEYACGAGARTLFRWGDHCPTDGEPTDELPWSEHLEPNAFGLVIGTDPYAWEFCAEPGLMRGGDGGSASCGGAGVLASWLTLATAFVQEDDPERARYSAFLRRACAIR